MRSELVWGDFFTWATATERVDKNQPQQKTHAVLLDIDHSPSHWLNNTNQSFYTEVSLTRLAEKIYSGGVFALWSNELPDEAFSELLSRIFFNCEAHTITFPNPYTGETSSNSVYVATVK